MNDDELELRLRDELHRRVVAPDAPGRLHRSIDRMGIDGDGRAAEDPRARVGFHPVSRRVGVLGGLATAAGIAALLAVSLAWRPSHNPGPAAGETATVSSAPSTAAPSTASPVAVATATPIPTAIPTPLPTWGGRPVVVAYVGRLDADFGWVVGNTSTADPPWNLYVTRDGGATWQTSTPPGLGSSADGIRFADRDHGAYAVDRKVYLTVDGGSTWTSSTVPCPPGSKIGSTDMLDGQRIWAATLSSEDRKMELWATTDGGATWSLRLSGKSDQLRLFTFVSETEGWGELGTIVAGRIKDPRLAHTLDGGRTWTSASLPLPADHQSLAVIPLPPVVSGSRLLLFLSPDKSAAGATGNVALVLLSSDDGGASWTLTSTTPVYAPPQRVGQSGSLFWLETQTDNLVQRLNFFDPLNPSFSATIDPPTTFCQMPSGHGSQRVGGGAGYTVVSTTDAWLTCGTFVGDEQALFHLYTTTDGGKTWRGLLGAP